MMRNPWWNLPILPPFILEEDAQAVESFSRCSANSPSIQIHLELLPEPFLGNPEAPIVLLTLNPGFSIKDTDCHSNPIFAELARQNLEHSKSEFPFYLLNPRIDAPGREWWEQKLGPLLKIAPREVVAQQLLCVEYFGYHSKRFAHHRLHLPSQEYSFMLVRKAIQRNAIIILTRGQRLWFSAIPELPTYSRMFTLKSVQNVTISERNCPDGFNEILSVLYGHD